MLSETEQKRLSELETKEGEFTEDERKEWVQLHEDQDNEAIDQITEEQKLQPLKDEKLRLEMERKRLELEVDIRAERIRIEKAHAKLDGKIWCEKCKKGVDEKHMREIHHMEYCDDHKDWFLLEHFEEN